MKKGLASEVAYIEKNREEHIKKFKGNAQENFESNHQEKLEGNILKLVRKIEMRDYEQEVDFEVSLC